MKPEQIAINSVTNRNGDIEACLAAYAHAGFRNVEFMLGHVKDYLAGGKSSEDVRKLLDRHDMRCIGGFDAPIICFGDADASNANHALTRDNARLLADLGAEDYGLGDPAHRTYPPSRIRWGASRRFSGTSPVRSPTWASPPVSSSTGRP